jgi:geranylgeranyl transferase type-2 subunit alpha
MPDEEREQRSEQNWSEEAFQQTTKLLLRNPEYYSIWNYRRNILMNGLFPVK